MTHRHTIRILRFLLAIVATVAIFAGFAPTTSAHPVSAEQQVFTQVQQRLTCLSGCPTLPKTDLQERQNDQKEPQPGDVPVFVQFQQHYTPQSLQPTTRYSTVGMKPPDKSQLMVLRF